MQRTAGRGAGVRPVPMPRREGQAANSKTKVKERELCAQNFKRSSQGGSEQLMVLGGGKTGSGSLSPGVVHRPLASESPKAEGAREGWEEIVKMHIPGVCYRWVLYVHRPHPHPEVILKHTHYFSEYRDDSSSKVLTQSNLAANPSSAT